MHWDRHSLASPAGEASKMMGSATRPLHRTDAKVSLVRERIVRVPLTALNFYRLGGIRPVGWNRVSSSGDRPV